MVLWGGTYPTPLAIGLPARYGPGAEVLVFVSVGNMAPILAISL